MYEIMSDLGKYLVSRYALCLKGSNMPRPPLPSRNYKQLIALKNTVPSLRRELQILPFIEMHSALGELPTMYSLSLKSTVTSGNCK